VLMAWIKMGAAAFVVSIIFVVFALAVAARLNSMLRLFDIPDTQLVTGAVQVNASNMPSAAVDLSHLNPATRRDARKAPSLHPSAAPSPRASGTSKYQPLIEEESGDGEAQKVHHEGHLFKKGEGGFLSFDTARRRYFVLRGSSLFYFKTWEDYGSSGIGAAVNSKEPIDLLRHDALVQNSGNRFDLVPHDPLGRKWELQAVGEEELRDWLTALRSAQLTGEF